MLSALERLRVGRGLDCMVPPGPREISGINPSWQPGICIVTTTSTMGPVMTAAFPTTLTACVGCKVDPRYAFLFFRVAGRIFFLTDRARAAVRAFRAVEAAGTLRLRVEFEADWESGRATFAQSVRMSSGY